MAEVDIDGKSLVVTLKSWHKIWALKSQLTYPVSHVRGAEIDPETAMNPAGVRRAGSFIPSILTAGSYRGPDGWDFWDVRHPANAIVIHLIDQNFKRLIIEVDDPRQSVEKINQAIEWSSRQTGPDEA